MRHFIYFLIFISGSVLADTNSHRQLAEELYKAMNVEASINLSEQNMRNISSRQLAEYNAPTEAKVIMQEYMNKQVSVQMEVLRSVKFHDAYMDSYMKLFTEKEIKTILDFYTSPTGLKFLKSNLEMQQIFAKVAEEVSVEMKVTERLLKLRKELDEKLEQVKNTNFQNININ
ncbi:hypothetical protein BIT28_05975 [Photobacterium proteolyticum]|uniref:DUF2059 domain-containing protein n=1 Tax=Photobacterium proteolyticum TaxID=1903952 RepID=A0A1Q9GEC0_9GAMM|nr:DUF2059 domain-containing protein [Photobacterium proteolyticum]OLQ72741.1 hypothetical protein BIT28_05975 [Photobacterium proteolyticum]